MLYVYGSRREASEIPKLLTSLGHTVLQMSESE